MTEINKDEFNAAVDARVEELLSSREEAHARTEAEEALKEAMETFDTLKTSLQAKDDKLGEYEEALANLDTSEPTIAEVTANEKFVELEASVKEFKQRAEVAEAALDMLAREETAASRMAVLDEAGVALDEEAAEAQYAKIRDMSDEEFESYKSELVALKAKYAPASEEEGNDSIEVSELSSEEVNMIAQSLGCDPSDSKCIALVREVAQKVAEVSNKRQSTSQEEGSDDEDPKKTDDGASGKEAAKDVKKETASTKDKKLSLGEAISMAYNQEIQAPADLKEEIAQEWEALYAERRGETNSE